MTNQEAIKILSELHDQCCQADSIFCTDTTGARCDAVDMAISALEKQISKKPINEPIDQSLHYKLCPRCQRKISGMEWGQAYCWRCGQAIDWEEE